MDNNWFASWFDSNYYHILYQNRDDEEAHFFITNLIDYLQLNEKSKVLDLACGKGRHSIFLAKKGLDVVGVDLSPESIAYAAKFEEDKLRFQTHDMRDEIKFGKFDAVLNLFTSFGYFDNKEDDLRTLEGMKSGLKDENSILLIDFFNAEKVIQKLVLKEEKVIENINFKLNRRVENGFIVKDICFDNEGKNYNFQECVKAFFLKDFQELFAEVGLELLTTFGGYDLSDFDAKSSNRLIMVLKIKN